VIAINHLLPQDWYGVSKLYAECRHRALAHLPIVDVRIFNYFSHTQNLESRFLITDLVRAIRDKAVFKTSAAHMVRDFLHPSDFYRLISAILAAPPTNVTLDSYSKAPIDKKSLLDALQKRFDFQFEVLQNVTGVNATGSKPQYYTLNRRAEDFGYQPMLTSLDGILCEIDLILK